MFQAPGNQQKYRLSIKCTALLHWWLIFLSCVQIHPMKIIYTLLLPVCLFLSASSPVKAQIDSAAIKQHISVFADSLVRSYYEKDWDTFMRLTHPGIARLYGGMEGYRGIVQGVR